MNKRCHKKIYLIFGVLLFNGFLYSQTQPIIDKESIIIWSEFQPLTWKDFRSNNLTLKEDLAISYVGMMFIPIKESKTNYKYEVLSIFNRDKSKSNVMNRKVLNHEQFHFHIVEIHARKVRRQIELNKNDKKLKLKDYEAVFDRYEKELIVFQKKYDKETKHGTRNLYQKKWEEKILLELKLLKLYKINN